METQALPSAPARVVLRDRRDLLLLAVTLWAWFLIANFADLTCHEGAHAVVGLLLGKALHGFYLSPVEGYVFSAPGALGESWVGTLDTMAGVPAGMLLGLTAVLVLRRGMGRYGLAPSAFLLWLAVSGLLIEPSYLAAGWSPSAVSGGDVQYLIRALGVPPLWFALLGLALMGAGGVTCGLLLKRWLATYVPGMSKRQSAAVAGMFAVFLALSSLIGNALQQAGRWA